jgi:hypothetical protein
MHFYCDVLVIGSGSAGLRAPTSNHNNNNKVNYEMRDLYHRKDKLASWINRPKTDLQESDKDDLLKFIQYLQDKENSILWIIRCISALFLIRKQLGKSSKDAIESIFSTRFTRYYTI